VRERKIFLLFIRSPIYMSRRKSVIEKEKKKKKKKKKNTKSAGSQKVAI